MPVAVLAELSEDLVAMHGQASQQLLRQPARQRDALDRYAGESTLAALAEALPRNERDLLAVPGVGPVKIDRYGTDLLRVLAQATAREQAS